MRTKIVVCVGLVFAVMACSSSSSSTSSSSSSGGSSSGTSGGGSSGSSGTSSSTSSSSGSMTSLTCSINGSCYKCADETALQKCFDTGGSSCSPADSSVCASH